MSVLRATKLFALGQESSPGLGKCFERYLHRKLKRCAKINVFWDTASISFLTLHHCIINRTAPQHRHNTPFHLSSNARRRHDVSHVFASFPAQNKSQRITARHKQDIILRQRTDNKRALPPNLLRMKSAMSFTNTKEEWSEDVARAQERCVIGLRASQGRGEWRDTPHLGTWERKKGELHSEDRLSCMRG
ncbi:hypothetical protein TNCV_2783311 [Trichonephila clavipes]|nr:hypothetical protein TNCV_2783311 [Trichonephila clavipes]